MSHFNSHGTYGRIFFLGQGVLHKLLSNTKIAGFEDLTDGLQRLKLDSMWDATQLFCLVRQKKKSS